MQKMTTKNGVEVGISWVDPNAPQLWLNLYQQTGRSSLLQDYDYMRVMAQMNFQKIRLGIVYFDDEPVAIFALQEASVMKNLVHALVLDMGPVWLGGYGSLEDFQIFLEAFTKIFPKRFGRKRRLIPNIQNSPEARGLIEGYGFQKAEGSTYQTIWLDLSTSEDELRAQLKKRWRNQLNRFDKEDIELVFCGEGAHFAWLMNHYASDKLQRGYHGASVKTISALARVFSRGQKLLIGTALLDGQPIASILIFIHGKSATYQVGYSSDVGREKRAHYGLLWRALLELKERNINAFDLGGINDQDAKGVRDFKFGMGGQAIELPGLYT